MYGVRLETGDVHICYFDDEGDMIHLSTDRDLEDAVILARSIGWRSLIVMLVRDKMSLPLPLCMGRDVALLHKFDTLTPLMVGSCLFTLGTLFAARRIISSYYAV
jgi:PB1 domain